MTTGPIGKLGLVTKRERERSVWPEVVLLLGLAFAFVAALRAVAR